MKLSIAIVTWNRQDQLIEALQSCVDADIPADTQFVIIDNASTDNTEESVNAFFLQNKYEYIYEKMSENIGAGPGRNYAYSKTLGEYVYFMDDDAYIDSSCSNFFSRAFEILDTNPRIATLTTQIYDLQWKRNRVTSRGHIIDRNVRHNMMICGGSHFLSRAFFKDKVTFFPNKYGFEEFLPSLRAVDAGYFNAFAESLLVIHNPLVNKWDYSNKNNEHLLLKEIAIPCAMKSKFYPMIVVPFVYMAFVFRCIKYLDCNLIKEAIRIVYKFSNSYEFGDRISLRTTLKMYKNFGLSIF